MKIKIERNQKEKIPKKKKERVISVGKHRKMVLALWLLLSCSLAFGIYKNFTAIDQHTTHEKVVVKEGIQFGDRKNAVRFSFGHFVERETKS